MPIVNDGQEPRFFDSEVAVSQLNLTAPGSGQSRARIVGMAAPIGSGAYLARRGYNCVHAEEGGSDAFPLAGQLIDRAASYTVTIKSAPAQVGPLERVRPEPSAAPECAWTDLAASSCASSAAIS